MKNIILLISIVTCSVLAGCSKNEAKCDTPIASAPASEVEALEQYLNTNKIEATKDSRGFYYTIEAAGSGKHPSSCSDVSVNYTGRLTNGTIFDQRQNLRFDLSTLIPGWQAGIPLISEAGKITLYLPPSLAYGSNPVAGIPANSILVFSIDLVKIY